MTAFWEWFWGEAGAAWILLILSLLVWLITWLRREQPPKVVVQAVYSLNPFGSFASNQKFQLVYTKSPDEEVKMNDFWIQKMVIYNAGTKDIEDSFCLTFYPLEDNERDDYWEWRVEGSAEIEYIQLPNPENNCTTKAVRLNFPFLNSYRVHNEDHIAVYVNSAFPLSLGVKEHSGKGWSLQNISLDEPFSEKPTLSDILNIGFIMAIPIIMVIIMVNLYYLYYIDPSFFFRSPESIAIVLVVVLTVAMFLVLQLKLRLKFWRKGIQPPSRFAGDLKGSPWKD